MKKSQLNEGNHMNDDDNIEGKTSAFLTAMIPISFFILLGLIVAIDYFLKR
jgi:hypothetical protein